MSFAIAERADLIGKRLFSVGPIASDGDVGRQIGELLSGGGRCLKRMEGIGKRKVRDKKKEKEERKEKDVPRS